MASSEELGDTLDVDVVGLVDLDFKSEPDFFDFDSEGEFGLFGEAGVALHTTATTTHTGQPTTTNSHKTPSSLVGTSTSTTQQQSSGSPNGKRSSHNRKRKSHWNEIEKDLFIKGMELFGPNWNRISNFIATKTAGQVRSFHKKWAETVNVIQESESLEHSYVLMPVDPGCITTDLEDPLGLIETATTTVTTTPLSPKRSRNALGESKKTLGIDDDAQDFHSSVEVFVPSVGEEWVIETDGMQTCIENVASSPKKSPEKRKKENHKKIKRKKNSSPVSQLPFKMKSPQRPKKKTKKLKLTIGLNGLNQEVVSQQVKSPTKENESLSKKSPAPFMEGQVVHIVKDDMEESDVDIDVSDDEQLMIVDKAPSTSVAQQDTKENTSDEVVETVESKSIQPVKEGYGSESRKQLVFNFSPPAQEYEMDMNTITEEEKKVHFEYFDSRGVKTPERYLKIRNYLLGFWKQVRPKYVRKTAVRAGLKNCGDVNSIGKVHEYLEKIGAINFGCPESNYSTPLIVGVKQKEKVAVPSKPVAKVDRSEVTRQKQKKKWDVSMSEGGGLTISHDESGAIVDACHIPEAPRNRAGLGAGRSGGRLEQFKLVRCLEHDPDTPAPFSVVMHAHALITLDIHAHTSLAEVMGLLGGYYDPAAHTLHVTVAVPTKAVSSGVECDMCPVSQSAACTAIHEGGVQVVGWYHSHPTFPPNPSVQDVETQSQMQQWFARQDAPFLGIIVSPYCPTNRSEASQIRCIVLDKPPHENTGNAEGGAAAPLSGTPYKLSWSVSEVIPGAWGEVCQGIRLVVGGAREDGMAVEWRGEWRGQVTNWEKAIASLKHHLPPHLYGPLQAVRTTFLAAVREYMDS
ncbi:histone H2A deubiquitinase MYSM1 [Penaeus vannamei]|uniref:histone H2A deubiquitinase MYSM1 n=1 Tax=Penaeus vannamei TaxID=6689 RepID=UPI00387F5B00